MPEVIRYEYQDADTPYGVVDAGRLAAEITAGGPAGFTAVYTTAGAFLVGYGRVLAGAEIDDLGMVVAAHDGRPRQTRPLHAIYADMAGLTAVQREATWEDLQSGSPKKLTLDTGPNAAALLVLDWTVSIGTLSNAERNEGRKRATTMYVQDNVTYLVHPPFAPELNIPGDEPVP